MNKDKEKADYHVNIKIGNKKEFKDYAKKMIPKYKATVPNICENPTDEFLEELFSFKFKFDFEPISQKP